MTEIRNSNYLDEKYFLIRNEWTTKLRNTIDGESHFSTLQEMSK